MPVLLRVPVAAPNKPVCTTFPEFSQLLLGARSFPAALLTESGLLERIARPSNGSYVSRLSSHASSGSQLPQQGGSRL